MDAQSIATAPESEAENAKLAPLFADIRLLGQVLGETVRQQEGEEVYRRIERIRRLSVAEFARRPRRGLRRSRRSAARTDRERRRQGRARLHLFLASRQHRRGPPFPAPPGGARARRPAGKPQPRLRADQARGAVRAAIAEALEGAYVSPVLTAHPDRSEAAFDARRRARNRGPAARARILPQ